MKRNSTSGYLIRFSPMLHTVIVVITLLFFSSLKSVHAQSWPSPQPPAPSYSEQLTCNYTACSTVVNMTLGHTIANPLAVHTVNSDMYYDCSGNGGGNVWVVAFDVDLQSGGSDVVLYALDVTSGSIISTAISNAKSPDIAILEVNPASASVGFINGGYGYFHVGVVYLDATTNDVMYTELDLQQAYGVGAFQWGGGSSTPVQINTNPSSSSSHPHIDACPDGSFRPFGGGNTYANMGLYAVTWHELNGGTDEIWFSNDYLSSANRGGPNLVANSLHLFDGIMPDIASVEEDDNMGTYAQKCYISYVANSGTDVNLEEYNFLTTTLNTIGTLETATTAVVMAPRIEAMNVQNTGLNNTNMLWNVVAQLDQGTGTDEIHSYDNMNGIINYSAIAPMNTPKRGQMPAVSAGNGQNGYAVASPGYLGNVSYGLGWYISSFELEALNLDCVSGSVLNGYVRVNNTAMAGWNAYDDVFSLSSSSNAGWASLAAYFNGTSVFAKMGNPTTFSFKPATISNVNAEKIYNVYPNPTDNMLTINGCTKANYTVTDMIGKIVANGTIDERHNKIGVASLTNGLYLLNLTENGYTQKVKFMKQ